MMEPVTARSAPLSQVDVPGGPSNFITSLANALNPASAAALSQAVTPDAPAPTPAPESPAPPLVETPAELAPTTPAPTETKAPELKKGFDGLEDGVDAKPDVKPPEGDDLPPDAKTPEAKNAWWSRNKRIKDLEAEKQAWEAEKAKLSAEAARVKQFTEADPEWQAYQKAKARLDEIEPVVARHAYTKTKDYRDTIETPRNEIGAAAKQMAEQFKIADSKMIAALTEADPVRQNELLEEVSTEMDARSKHRLFSMAESLDRLAALDDRMAANAMAAAKEADALEAQRTQQATVERKAAEMRSVENSRPRLTKVASLFTLDGETSESAVESVIKMAQETPFGEQDLDAQTFAVLSSGLVPRMQKVILARDATITQLRKEIAELASATPRVGAGSSNGATGQKPMGFIESLAAAQAGIGQ